MMRLALWALVGLAPAVLIACSGSNECAPRVVTTDAECKTTTDCIDAGYKSLSCINGACARACIRDEDCELPMPSDEEVKTCPELDNPAPAFICELQLCKTGCPDAPCAAGEICQAGRCAIYFEGFELREGQDSATPKSLGFDFPEQSDRLRNNETVVASSGAPGCNLGDDRCAGPSAEGVQFLALERVPTPAHGTPTTDITCRACACCVECMLNPPANGNLATIPSCPGAIEQPDVLMCPASTPGVCQSVCNECSSCAAAPPRRELGDGLLACEMEAATKSCSSCVSFDTCFGSCIGASDRCDAACMACVNQNCAALRDPCFACRDAIQCDHDNEGSLMCIQLHQTCDAQGADGCFNTAIARPRSQLTEDEQALTSPKIPGVAGTAGRVVLQFEYVPFDIRDTYRRVIQEMPASTWPVEPQEVVVQLCGGGCENSSGWVDGKLKSGAVASIPPASQRRNGLLFAAQSAIDWRANRVEVDIPAELRTADFRFRFLPRLGDDARVGLDNVFVRRRP